MFVMRCYCWSRSCFLLYNVVVSSEFINFFIFVCFVSFYYRVFPSLNVFLDTQVKFYSDDIFPFKIINLVSCY